MDTLQTMRVFSRVAQRSGFASAARDLRMSRAAVTKHVAALESSLGARLLHRTSRSVSLTEAGRVYLERCLACLQASDDATESVRQLVSEPSGSLRVSAAYDLQQVLAPIVGRFVRDNLKVRLELRYSNRLVDLVEEGFDVGVRAGRGLDGPYIARVLRPMTVMTCASPKCLKEHGRPSRPQDLAHVPFLVFGEPQALSEIPFERGGKRQVVKVTTTFISNGGDTILEAAIAGAGFMVAPDFLAAPALEAGHLERVLTDWRVFPNAKLYAVYPHRRFVSPSTRAFLDFLQAELGA
jgi:DNA-binding transcriptional LysR family regulator